MPLYEIDGIRPDLAGRPGINEDCWVAQSATLIGNVHLKAKSSVWFNVVMRGDNEPITIGRGSNVQELVMCHTDPGFPLTVGENCTIGHKALLHGCTIGDNSLVGMGAMVMNGAVIGKNCLIGAGALVSEGKTIPDNSLVLGVPGKVVRELDERGIAGLTMSAEIYQKNADRFRKGLIEVS